MESKLDKITEIVSRELSCSAHDLQHVFRVNQLCLKLTAQFSEVNLEVLQAAALLHDIARVKEDQDPSGEIDHAVLGAAMARDILGELGYPQSQIEAVCHCITAHRFRSGNIPQSLEAQILFDADKLDVLGAIGIARSFVITGEYGEPIYADVDLNEYIKDNLVDGLVTGRVKDISKHAANLEYELKLKRIPERLFTAQARQIAAARLEFMRLYFDRLSREMRGEL